MAAPSAFSLQPSAFDEGVRLFNAGHFWHAHEQWEECWLVAAEPDASFYKGIIQAAAALVHWQRGNNVGLHRNWAKSRPKLVALLPHYGGVDLGALIAAMDTFVAADPSPQHAPPRIALLPL
ncbi:MAG: DUF309 domain-containing protein [Chloroflexales bacterium]|nr:DUF309 domain-containing protein [Chloroflexales bacterium]